MSDITSQSLFELTSNIKEKKLSSEEITKAFINRAERSKKLNVYVTDNFEKAIDQSKKFDSNPNFDLKLPGIPIAVKDLFCTNGVRSLKDDTNHNQTDTQRFLAYVHANGAGVLSRIS